MIIKGVKSIRKVEPYIEDLNENENYYLGLKIDKVVKEKLLHLGFSKELPDGDALLPDVKNGKFSKFNTLGGFRLRRDLPKENYCYSYSRDIEDWHGTSHYVIITRCIKRIAREKLQAPEIELLLNSNISGEKFIIANYQINLHTIDQNLLKHIINLFLELFGYVEFLKRDLNTIPKINNITLRWEVLPKGELPWDQKDEYIKSLGKLAAKSQRRMLSDRLDIVEDLKPNFRAVGINGYRGYIIYGFEEKNIFIFESAFYGNATYIIEGKWEDISKMTKAEIIGSGLCKHRLIHDKNWKNKIKKLLPR